MSDQSDKPNVPSTPPSTPAPAATTPPTTPAKTDKPPENRKFQRGGGGGSDRGGRPKQRMRESVPSLQSDFDYRAKQSPNVRDLDAEIAAELEAAMQGVDHKTMFAAETSQQAQAQATAQPDQGRKVGKVISIHAPDVFIEVPGGRSQGS